MAKNTGKVREFCQSGKVGTLKKYYLVAGGKNEIYYVVIWTWKTPPARPPTMAAWAPRV